MDLNRLGGSVRREGVSVNHRDLGTLPLLGREESLTVVGAQVLRNARTGGQTCAACGRVLVRVEDFYAVCVCCGMAICSEPQCRVFCAEETCRQVVCPQHRKKVGESQDGTPEYLCDPHYKDHERQVLVVTAVVLGTLAVLAVVLYFMFM